MTKEPEAKVFGGGTVDAAHKARHATELHEAGSAYAMARVDDIRGVLLTMIAAHKIDPQACCPLCAGIRAFGYFAAELLSMLEEGEDRDELLGTMKEIIDHSAIIVAKSESAGTA